MKFYFNIFWLGRFISFIYTILFEILLLWVELLMVNYTLTLGKVKVNCFQIVIKTIIFFNNLVQYEDLI